MFFTGQSKWWTKGKEEGVGIGLWKSVNQQVCSWCSILWSSAHMATLSTVPSRLCPTPFCLEEGLGISLDYPGQFQITPGRNFCHCQIGCGWASNTGIRSPLGTMRALAASREFVWYSILQLSCWCLCLPSEPPQVVTWGPCLLLWSRKAIRDKRSGGGVGKWPILYLYNSYCQRHYSGTKSSRLQKVLVAPWHLRSACLRLLFRFWLSCLCFCSFISLPHFTKHLLCAREYS